MNHLCLKYMYYPKKCKKIRDRNQHISSEPTTEYGKAIIIYRYTLPELTSHFDHFLLLIFTLLGVSISLVSVIRLFGYRSVHECWCVSMISNADAII